MADRETDSEVSGEVTRMSDAMGREFGRTGLRRQLYEVKTWVMVDVNRWLLIAALTVLVFAVTVLVGAFGPVSVQQYLIEGTSASDGYVELQTITVSVVTIALTINQLVLSPQLGPLSTQRKRLNDVISHQTGIENSADIPKSPTDPAEYLRTIAETTGDRATRLAREVENAPDEELRRRVQQYTDRVREETAQVAPALDGRRLGKIAMFGAANHIDITRDIAELRGLQNEYKEELSDPQQKAFDDLLDILKQFSIAQEYFQTIYIRMEFANFSHALLYTVLPALLVAHYTVNIIDPAAFPGATLGIQNLLWFEAAAFTISVLPVLVLISYIARLSTLGKLTALVPSFTERRS